MNLFNLPSPSSPDMLSHPTQACYLPYLYVDEDFQSPMTVLDDRDGMEFNDPEVIPSAPRISPTELPLTPIIQLPRRAIVSLRPSAVIEVDNANHAHSPPTNVIIEGEDQEPEGAHGKPVQLSSRFAGRSKGRKFSRATPQAKRHSDSFQSITCAPTLRHMSFEVSLTIFRFIALR